MFCVSVATGVSGAVFVIAVLETTVGLFVELIVLVASTARVLRIVLACVLACFG